MVQNILALLDFSPVTDAVLDKAAEFSHLYHAKCWLVHVATPDPDFVGYGVGPQYIRDSRADELKEEHRMLQEYKAAMEIRGVDAEALLIKGPLFETIDAEIEKLGIELIVLGSHGRSKLYELVVGSVCEHLLRHAKVPLVVIPDRGRA